MMDEGMRKQDVGRGERKVVFDRTKPGGGAKARCRIENGKAWITWEFYLREEADSVEARDTGNGEERLRLEKNRFAGQSSVEVRNDRIALTVTDAEGRTVLKAVKQLKEEEPLETLLLHPHLWQGVEDPYLYHVNAELIDSEGRLADQLYKNLPLREIIKHPEKGILLNGEAFLPRIVRYGAPEAGEKESLALQLEGMLQRLRLLREMGANGICYEPREPGENLRETLRQMCDKYGLLFLEQIKGGHTQGTSRDRVLLPERAEEASGREMEMAENLLDAWNRPTSLFYRYKAMWCSREPFVYIVPESVSVQKDGSYRAVVYSNGSRVALYTDGTLHGFQTGETVFSFEGIPARHPCVMLAAEGEGCSMSLSLHKTYVKGKGGCL